MSTLYSLLWAVLTLVNGTALWFWYRRFQGWTGTVIFKGRTYRVVEQQWEFDEDRLRIVAETGHDR